MDAEGLLLTDYEFEELNQIYEDLGRRARNVLGESPAPNASGAKETEQPKIEKTANEEVLPIINLVEDKGCRSTLKGEKPEVVLAVVRAVRKMRLENPGITDREVYLRYRDAIESENPKPTLVRATQIIQNLMGGNISGQLPFQN